jgi:16S rRNA (adenine1518-N6/adenine1519-N6)-dimethyltransferase
VKKNLGPGQLQKTPGHGQSHGIPLKKQFGQHFLRVQSIIDTMINAVPLNSKSSVFEIGCGDGFLTRSILQMPIERLWIFEIDPDWVAHVTATYPDKRMQVFLENILDVDFDRFKENAPWILLANLPYQVTFPILRKLKENRHLLQEGVIMVQEEVAQKVVATHGRGYGYPSIYFQHFFEWRLLTKVKPDAFYPPPKVDSRLLYFKPRPVLDEIPDEENFWIFIKRCFIQPRRTLKNNLQMFHYDISGISEEILALRGQQMNKLQLLDLWKQIIKA